MELLAVYFIEKHSIGLLFYTKKFRLLKDLKHY